MAIFLGLKYKEGVSKFAGGPFGLWGRGVKFSKGLGFRRRKSLFVALNSTNFQKYLPAADILPYFNSQFTKFTNSTVGQTQGQAILDMLVPSKYV